MPNYMTKYELAKVIGMRSLQITNNENIKSDAINYSSYLMAGVKDNVRGMAEVPSYSPYAIAIVELLEGKIELFVRRHLPTNNFLDVPVSSLTLTIFQRNQLETLLLNMAQR